METFYLQRYVDSDFTDVYLNENLWDDIFKSRQLKPLGKD